jgi:hypothetical protein
MSLRLFELLKPGGLTGFFVETEAPGRHSNNGDHPLTTTSGRRHSERSEESQYSFHSPQMPKWVAQVGHI